MIMMVPGGHNKPTDLPGHSPSAAKKYPTGVHAGWMKGWIYQVLACLLFLIRS